MFKPITIILLVLSLLYIGYVVFEHFYHKAKRKKIKHVIHVNGIRGKSTTTRLIDAGLRACGYKVFSKTTGTIPTYIDVDGVSHEIKRLGPANVREQLKMIRLAASQNADVLVLECMAVNPELQYITENNMLHADINVITNVRADHLDEMGSDLESIAYSLANTTPTCGVVVLGEDKFKNVFDLCAAKKNSRTVVAKPYTGSDLMDTFAENIAVALQVAEEMGCDKETFLQGMKNYVHDPGALSALRLGDSLLINGFSVNDPDSILEVYGKISEVADASQITVLLNERADRVFRIDQHVEMLTKMQFKQVYICGSNVLYVKKKLAQKGIQATVLRDITELASCKVVFGCGNIFGQGMKTIKYYGSNGTDVGDAFAACQAVFQKEVDSDD